ncbi:MAG: dihydropteroate synthase [Chitinophagaceae bacterium]
MEASSKKNHRIAHYSLQCNGILLSLDTPKIMGVINLSPDSFYAGSRLQHISDILTMAEKMLQDGAAILDLGAQSTRPGSERLGEDEELHRLIGAVEALHKEFPEAILSIDTYLPKVARLSVTAGASIINDISGGGSDDEMLETVSLLGVPYICMHMRGNPGTMHKQQPYDDIGIEVMDYFIQKIARCQAAGIKDLVLDPGFGFSKNIDDNFRLLHELPALCLMGKPLLAGISRKSTIYKTLGITPEEALNGSTVLHTICLLNGARILRVHDVLEAVEAVKLVGRVVGV